jgi:ABC-type multidrug transport system fused ATPase/permease subunit
MKEELHRKYRVINMMITMHSVMYHKYKTKTLIGSIFFMIAAIVLNVFTFFDYSYLSFIGLDEKNIKNIIAIISFFIFLLSVIFMLTEWSKKSEQHLQSINQLSRLLNKLRAIQKIDDTSVLSHKSELFEELYNQIFETIPKIADNKFNSLKARHYKKVELSKFIDKHKGKPFFVIKILFFYNETFKPNEK